MRATDRLQRFFNSVATKSFPAKRDQCVFVLDHLNHDILYDNNGGKKNDNNEKNLSISSEEEINSQIKQKQQSQVTFSQIPLKPFGTIYPVTFLGKNNKMCTQNVPFYNVQCIWGTRGVGRFKGFLKIPKNENPMLGMITHRHTKQLAISLW
ncbi:20378_t:CDS:2, partial [Dentiscutata erythropus]